MRRRDFLRLLGAGALGAAATALAPDVDLERLLWVPGAKKIFLPPPPALVTPGIAMRFLREYHIDLTTFPCRIDVLYGWATVRPELACVVTG